MVSEKDLFDALQKGKIKGAALDVFNEEPAKKNILFGLENIILTPHIAASTEESQIIVAEMVANQISDSNLSLAELAWPALLRMLDSQDPSYRD